MQNGIQASLAGFLLGKIEANKRQKIHARINAKVVQDSVWRKLAFDGLRKFASTYYEGQSFC
ncbi:hypothetical protein KJ590_02585 [Patescibacteria group bacterium]|nr:hypothetical protein [Patescibacteria group bacterium]